MSKIFTLNTYDIRVYRVYFASQLTNEVCHCLARHSIKIANLPCFVKHCSNFSLLFLLSIRLVGRILEMFASTILYLTTNTSCQLCQMNDCESFIV